MSMLKKCSFVFSVLACMGIFLSDAKAADYPTKTITLISPYGAGGDSDLSARVWAEFASKELGQRVIVANKTGGGGLTGTMEAARARADGYTLFLAQAGPCITIPLTTNTGGLNKNSFNFVSRFAVTYSGVVVNKDAPWKNLKEFEAAAKKSPNTLIFSDPSPTSWLTFAFRGWLNENDIKTKIVSYTSGAEAATSLIGKPDSKNSITMLFPANYNTLVNSGELKLLAVGAKNDKHPNVQTFEEQGYKGSYYAWSGIAVPANTPQAVKDKIMAVTDKITKNPEFIKAIQNLGFIVDNTSGEAFQKAVDKQYEEMTVIVKSLGYTVK